MTFAENWLRHVLRHHPAPVVLVDAHPPCPACDALGPPESPETESPETEHPEAIRSLDDPAELLALAPAVTDRKHAIRPADVLATYSLPTDARCSMPGRHPHRSGLVARTRCGLVLALGNDCGAVLVHGVRRLEAHVRRSREYHRFLPAVREQLAELRREYAETHPRERGLREVRDRIQRDIPLLAQDSTERWRSRGRLPTEQVPAGAALWNWNAPSVDLVARDLTQLERRFLADDGAPLRLTFQERRGVLADVQRLRERVRAVAAWTQEASAYVTRAGLERACWLLDSVEQLRHVEVYDEVHQQTVTRPRPEWVRRHRRVVVEGSDLVELDTGVAIAFEWG